MNIHSWIILVSIVSTFNCVLLSCSQSKSMEYKKGLVSYNVGIDTLPYRIYIPSEISKPVPLLLFLHGAGERGNENERQLIHIPDHISSESFQKNQPCIILAPQCPKNGYWAQVEKPSFTVDSKGEPTSAAQGLPILLDKIIQEHPIDTHRIYIAGLSMGGMGTLDLLARYPDRFTGAIAVCGAADTSMVHNYTHIPLHIAHGAKDNVVPVEKSRNLIKALKTAGAMNVRYREYPDLNHNSWDTTFTNPEVFEWLFSQTKTSK